MKDLCGNCHTRPVVDRVYDTAKKVVTNTNEKVKAVRAIMTGYAKMTFSRDLRNRSTSPISTCGITMAITKHGAFMGGTTMSSGTAITHSSKARKRSKKWPNS